MQSSLASRTRLESALAAHGLRVRGGWVPCSSDTLPGLPGGAMARVVWMVGQIGSECWRAFSASPFFCDGQADPMDRWAKSIGNTLAQPLGGVAVYPSDGPPYYPFQQWARRAEPLQSSPLMLQIHPDYGLWHAYRFALVLPELVDADTPALANGDPVASLDLCLQCDGQPCLSACPVEAFTSDGFSAGKCTAYLHRPEGQSCALAGCQARLACPVAPVHRYTPEHAAFHMAAFAQR